MLAIPINRKTIEFKVSVENWRCLMLKIVRVVLQLGMFLLGIMEYPTLEPHVGAQIDFDLTLESNLVKDFS